VTKLLPFILLSKYTNILTMLKFEYRLTLKDFKEFNQVHSNPMLLKLCLLYAGIFMFLAVLPLLSKRSISFQEVLLVVVLPNLLYVAIFCAAIYIIQHFSIKRAWNNSHAIKNETITEVDDEELTIITPLSRSILKWAIYTHWKETSNLFLVYQSHTCSSIFPKRAFISDEQIDEFRALLMSKLPNK
jgi:YcxB-like protein